MVVRLIERKLVEDFNSSFPDWLVSSLTDRRYNSIKSLLLKKNVDLNNAKFVRESPPTSSRDPRLKDTNILPLFLMNDGTVYSPRLPSTGDTYIYYTNSEGKREMGVINKMSWKTVLSNVKDYGYIDMTNSSNLSTDIRAQRKASKSGSVDRSHPQYRNPVYGDKVDKYGLQSRDSDNIVGYKWLTHPGYDKSGYPLDPEKYIKMLNTLNLSNYAQKLSKYYDSIKKTQSDLSKAVMSADVDNTKYRGRSSFASDAMSDVREAADSLSRAIREYRDLQRYIETILGRQDLSDDKKNKYLQERWGPSGKKIYDYLKEADATIKAILDNKSYEED